MKTLKFRPENTPITSSQKRPPPYRKTRWEEEEAKASPPSPPKFLGVRWEDMGGSCPIESTEEAD